MPIILQKMFHGSVFPTCEMIVSVSVKGTSKLQQTSMQKRMLQRLPSTFHICEVTSATSETLMLSVGAFFYRIS